jgi:hypothetical protein
MIVRSVYVFNEEIDEFGKCNVVGCCMFDFVIEYRITLEYKSVPNTPVVH